MQSYFLLVDRLVSFHLPIEVHTAGSDTHRLSGRAFWYLTCWEGAAALTSSFCRARYPWMVRRVLRFTRQPYEKLRSASLYGHLHGGGALFFDGI